MRQPPPRYHVTCRDRTFYVAMRRAMETTWRMSWAVYEGGRYVDAAFTKSNVEKVIRQAVGGTSDDPVEWQELKV